ncbi:unnamed protein product [Cylicocyclus nassatus]|uniref:FYVE-type domain-containing protein n=1 Tax=Cylicocyclus nassatus TaxID=53992 RepID=A0AA36DLQ1_CYLNA|nr:unnamed protein product [Cylicocyclus nassatus]
MWNMVSAKKFTRLFRSRKSIHKRKMSPVCCTNCRTKYSILNPEEGCSNCALSFCRKCLSHRALLPQLANKPVSVCAQCFEKLNAETIKNQEKNGVQITRITIGNDSPPQVHSSNAVSSRTGNWWGDGLPPPSLRQTVESSSGVPHNKILPPPRILHAKVRAQAKKAEHPKDDVHDLEERFKKSRQDDSASGQPLTVEEIEERLAALRGCDVELVRRPRCMFETSGKQIPAGNTVQGLMKMAQERAEIEEKHDPAKELERRHRALRGEEEQGGSRAQQEEKSPADSQADQSDPRLSTVSSSTAFSESTAKELDEIKRLLEEADKRVKSEEIDDKEMKKKMKKVVAATRQESLDIEKVSNELGHFWEKQLDKSLEEVTDSDDETIDEETMKKIILEAEQAINEAEEVIHESPERKPTPHEKSVSPKPEEAGIRSPTQKKPGLFSKIFRR